MDLAFFGFCCVSYGQKSTLMFPQGSSYCSRTTEWRYWSNIFWFLSLAFDLAGTCNRFWISLLQTSDLEFGSLKRENSKKPPTGTLPALPERPKLAGWCSHETDLTTTDHQALPVQASSPESPSTGCNTEPITRRIVVARPPRDSVRPQPSPFDWLIVYIFFLKF